MKKRSMKKAFVFDFDDTLATTKCKVMVRSKANKHIVAMLTSEEFNTHVLHPSCRYDFCEFKQGSFIKNASPTWLIHLAKEVSEQGHNVYILTAREDHVRNEITAWLNNNSINVEECFCVGGSSENISQRKKEILLDTVGRYDKVYFYDDSEENVNIFQHERLRSYLV